MHRKVKSQFGNNKKCAKVSDPPRLGHMQEDVNQVPLPSQHLQQAHQRPTLINRNPFFPLFPPLVLRRKLTNHEKYQSTPQEQIKENIQINIPHLRRGVSRLPRSESAPLPVTKPRYRLRTAQAGVSCARRRRTCFFD